MAGVHGDGARPITAVQSLFVPRMGQYEGAFYHEGDNANNGISMSGVPLSLAPDEGSAGGEKLFFSSGRVTPTANKFQTRSYGVNGCVWFGLAS